MTFANGFGSYEEMISDPLWQERLSSLNAALVNSMEDLGSKPVLNGNIFYDHKDPDFRDNGLVARFEAKRKNIFNLSRRLTSFLEVGVNGGHSLFLALSANPDIKVIGIDVAERLDPDWAPVERYVPAAFDWLHREFPGRCVFIKGNSLVELPRFVLDHPSMVIDAVHLDGAKNTHLRELLAVLPLMRKGGYAIFDDANTAPVRKGIDQVKALNIARPRDLTHLGLERTPGHRVFPIIDATV